MERLFRIPKRHGFDLKLTCFKRRDQAQMKCSIVPRIGISIVLLIVLMFTLFDSNLGSASEDYLDWVKQSEKWWGIAIEDFPAASNLKIGEFSQLDDPETTALPGYKVIMPDNPKWEPRTLKPAALHFTPEKGLKNIDGFIRSPSSDILSVLNARYGAYKNKICAIETCTFVWVLDRTVLEVSFWGPASGLFTAHPK